MTLKMAYHSYQSAILNIKQLVSISLLLILLVLSSFSLADTIKIGLAHLPPIVIIQRDQKTNAILNVTGTYVNMYDWIAKQLRLEYELISVSENEIEKKGVYTASMDQMAEDDEIDIAAVGYVALPGIDYVEYSFPVNRLQYRFVTPFPGYQSRVWAVFRPFQPMVWISLSITAILVIFTLSLLLLLKKNGQGIEWPLRLGQKFAYSFQLVVSNITNQGNSIPVNSRISFRILAGAWFLVALILVNSYAGILIPSLTVRKMKPVINSVQDFINGDKQEGLKLAVNVDSYFGNCIMDMKSGMYKTLGDQLRSHPDGQFRSADSGKTLLATMRYAVLDPEPATNYAMGLDYKMNNGTCRYWESSPVGFTSYTVLALKKNGKFNKMINKALQRMAENGLFRYWLKQEQDKLRYDKCKARNILKPITQPRTPIKLSDLSSAFIIFGLGILLAGFVFIVERFISFLRL